MSRSSRLQSAIFSLLPPALGDDMKDSIAAVIQSQFEQMNLVSRSEFEVQQKKQEDFVCRFPDASVTK